MKPLNTLPIENFLEKSRIAIKSNQKTINLDIKEVQALADCLAVVMTRLTAQLDADLQNIQNQPNVISINMDGGGFR
jgi:ribosomal silencing factor RsfS